MIDRLVGDIREVLLGDDFRGCFDEATAANEWFTVDTIQFAVDAIVSQMLDLSLVRKWLSGYDLESSGGEQQVVGVVMAGNIPMVGFFDLFCTLVTGNRALVKLSSKDGVLMGRLVEELRGRGWPVQSCSAVPPQVDKLITMGGAEAAEYYATQFGRSIPTLIRSHRYSVAVLTGDETPQQLNGLLDDMFCHWGLGCRNVNRLYLAQGYDLERLPRFTTDFKPFVDNYRYQKALCTMYARPYCDKGGYLLLNDDGTDNTEPPIAVIKYSYFTESPELDESRIQCVVTNSTEPFVGKVALSESQKPSLLDYPDAKDVIKFLING